MDTGRFGDKVNRSPIGPALVMLPLFCVAESTKWVAQRALTATGHDPGQLGPPAFVAHTGQMFYTGLVTLASQELSEFALHARAILGLPVPHIRHNGASASCALLASGHGVPHFDNIDTALRVPDTALRLFGKPVVEGQRRVGVTLARAADVEQARAIAREAAAAIGIELR